MCGVELGIGDVDRAALWLRRGTIEHLARFADSRMCIGHDLSFVDQAANYPDFQ
jgi:hypothetical protein